MDLDRVDPSVFKGLENKKRETEGVLSDPHLYLCLVFMGILFVMSLFACSHVEPLPNVDLPKQEAAAIHK